MAWQKEFNKFEPLKAPSPELVAAQQKSYSWQSLQGQWVNQNQQFETDLGFSGFNQLGPPPFNVGQINVNQPTEIDWVTCTINVNSQNVGILISADNQLFPLSAQFVPLTYQLPNFQYYISPGNILIGLGIATGTFANVNLGKLYIAGEYDSASGLKGATFYVDLELVIQQNIKFQAIQTAVFAGQPLAHVSIGVQYKVQG